MFFAFTLVPATIWVVIGYFVVFVSAKEQGAIRRFGQALAIWIFVIALLIPLLGAYVTLSGLSPFGQMMQQMHH